MKKLFFILFFPSILFAGQDKTDSLKKVLLIAEEDTAKANILNDISREITYTQDENALHYSEQAFALSSKNNYQYGMAQSWNNRGSIYVFLGRYDKALFSYLNAIKIWEFMGNKQRLGSCYNGIGKLYLTMGNTDKALEYFSKALEMAVATDFKKGKAGTLHNIASVYKAKGDYKNALANYKNALAIFKELNDEGATASVLNNMAMIYQESEDYNMALNYYKKSLAIKEKTGDKMGEASTLLNLGFLYDTLGKYDLSVDFTRKSLNMALEINSKHDIWSAYNNLSFIFAHQKNYREAYKYSILSVQVGDSILNTESNKQVTVMFTDFKDFTQIAEKLSAEELVSELDFFFKKFDEIISKYPIEKIKTIGDAYMCVGGLPAANATHAIDILNAAIEIQDWMNSPLLTSLVRGGNKSQVLPNGEVRKDSFEDLGGAWQLRIGIHTGPVTAGVVGAQKFVYDIWGDTVNTASRMESSGKAGKINISGATYELVKHSPLAKGDKGGCAFTHRGKIPAKNKGEIEMYFIERSKIPLR